MDTLTPAQQKQLEALQQADMKRQLQRQQVLLHNGAGSLNAAMAANKKQREVYVGNLAIGAVSEIMLRELFNAALAHFVSDPVTRPPVVSTTMDGSGRFGFVELRTEELSAEAMKLDRVNLGGREINVGRPKGYIEPPPGSRIDPNKVRSRPLACCRPRPALPLTPLRALTAARRCAQPTRTLFMENLLAIGETRVEADRLDLQLEVDEECRACGGLEEVIVPAPPLWVANEEPAPVFCRFADEAACAAAKAAMNGRQFENNTVTAKFISDEMWDKVKGGEWVDHKLIIDNPNQMGGPPLAPPGQSVLYPNLLPQALMGAGYVSGSAGPGASGGGYVMRIFNLPRSVAKHDIVTFLDGCNVGEGHVRLVRDSADEPTGEAYIDCPNAESLARGIALDRSPFLATNVFVSVQSSSFEERNKVTTSGHHLV